MASAFSAPRLARLDEFDEAMAFTDRVFRPGQRGRRILQRQYPHAYRETRSFARRLLLMRDEAADDALVGCLAIHPMQLRVGAAQVTAGGIGIVGADPQRRGEGIMTQLLQDSLTRMRASGHAISILGGDRQRYGWFGWENGGIRHRYLLTGRMLGGLTTADRRLALTRLDAADGGAFRRLHALAGGRPVGVHHRVSDVAPLFLRNGRETWILRQGRRWAALCLRGPGRRNRPYQSVDAAYGDPELLTGGLRRLMSRFRRDQLWALAGPNPEEASLFEPIAASWLTEDDLMIRILDLPLLVEQLGPELRARRRALGLKVPDLRLELTDLGQVGTLVGGGKGQHRLALTSTQAVRWFFGSRALPATELSDCVPSRILTPWAALLPLPLHVPPLHHI